MSENRIINHLTVIVSNYQPTLFKLNASSVIITGAVVHLPVVSVINHYFGNYGVADFAPDAVPPPQLFTSSFFVQD
jgi:hypothetical protein